MFWIRGRRNWGAKPPKNAVTRDPWGRGVTLVVHHTAGGAPRTKLAEEQEMRAIQRLHQLGRGWNDIGYNYVIMPSGRVYEGRGFGIRGAHTANHNTGTIGVSFAGNYETHHPTTRQLIAFRLLRARLRQHGAKITAIKGHRQMPGQSTACPGKHLTRTLGL